MATTITSGCSCRLRSDNIIADVSRPGTACSSGGPALRGSFVFLTASSNNRVVKDVSAVPITFGGKGSRRGQPRTSITVRAVLADIPAKSTGQSENSEHGQQSALLTEPVTPLLITKPEMGLSETPLTSTLEHRLWVAFGAIASSGMVVKAVQAAQSSSDIAGVGLGVVAGYILADLGTGIYHWGVDNYGSAKTPVFGSQIDAFQGHHQRPWTITKREFCNNTEAIARPVGTFLLPFLLLPGNPTAHAFLGVFLGLVIMSQQIHAWAHSKKRDIPPVVKYLQDQGILVSRKMHGIHHRPPYNVNYCIVSGMWNGFLKNSKFFPWLETASYSIWRVAPRCWTENVASEWLQNGSYFEDGSEIPVDLD